MGACASKFTVLKNGSTAPPPAVKCEVESKEVNLVEEVAVEKDDAPAVEDESKRRQSLGHLLQEGEEKKGSADSNGKASEDVNHDAAAEVKPEAVADAPVQDQRDEAPIADGLKPKCVEEEISADQNMEMEVEKTEDKPAETLMLETTQENKSVEISVTDKEPVTLETEKAEAKKPASDEEIKKEEEKLAEDTKLETSEKTPETPEAGRTEEQCPAPDAEKKETDEKSTEIIETPEKKPEATEEQKPASEAERKNAEEKPCEISDKKPESPDTEKTEEQKPAADTNKNVMEEKPAENSKTETSEKVEDKHVLEPQTTENLVGNKTPETCSGEEQKPPASDAEKPKAGEEKASN